MSLQAHCFNKAIFFFAQRRTKRLFCSRDPGGFPRGGRKADERLWTDAFYFHWCINTARERLCDSPLRQPRPSGGEGGLESAGAARRGRLLPEIRAGDGASLTQKRTKSGAETAGV